MDGKYQKSKRRYWMEGVGRMWGVYCPVNSLYLSKRTQPYGCGPRLDLNGDPYIAARMNPQQFSGTVTLHLPANYTYVNFSGLHATEENNRRKDVESGSSKTELILSAIDFHPVGKSHLPLDLNIA
jgi:hypothetical protein